MDYGEYLDQLDRVYGALFSVVGPVLLLAVLTFFRSQSAKWTTSTKRWELAVWAAGFVVALVSSVLATLLSANATLILGNPPLGLLWILWSIGITVFTLAILHIWQIGAAWVNALVGPLDDTKKRRRNRRPGQSTIPSHETLKRATKGTKSVATAGPPASP